MGEGLMIGSFVLIRSLLLFVTEYGSLGFIPVVTGIRLVIEVNFDLWA